MAAVRVLYKAAGEDNGCTTRSRKTMAVPPIVGTLATLGQASLNRKLDTSWLNLGDRVLQRFGPQMRWATYDCLRGRRRCLEGGDVTAVTVVTCTVTCLRGTKALGPWRPLFSIYSLYLLPS
jgi:hypothetical protein